MEARRLLLESETEETGEDRSLKRRSGSLGPQRTERDDNTQRTTSAESSRPAPRRLDHPGYALEVFHALLPVRRVINGLFHSLPRSRGRHNLNRFSIVQKSVRNLVGGPTRARQSHDRLSFLIGDTRFDKRARATPTTIAASAE